MPGIDQLYSSGTPRKRSRNVLSMQQIQNEALEPVQEVQTNRQAASSSSELGLHSQSSFSAVYRVPPNQRQHPSNKQLDADRSSLRGRRDSGDLGPANTQTHDSLKYLNQQSLSPMLVSNGQARRQAQRSQLLEEMTSRENLDLSPHEATPLEKGKPTSVVQATPQVIFAGRHKRRQSQLPDHFRRLFSRQSNEGPKDSVLGAALIQKQDSRLQKQDSRLQKKAGPGPSPVSGEIRQIQEMLQLFRSDINQMKQNYQNPVREIWQRLEEHQNESFHEFEIYFPWNNLGNVLMKKNFRRMKQLRNMVRSKGQSYFQNFPGIGNGSMTVRHIDTQSRKDKGFQEIKEEEDEF